MVNCLKKTYLLDVVGRKRLSGETYSTQFWMKKRDVGPYYEITLYSTWCKEYYGTHGIRKSMVHIAKNNILYMVSGAESDGWCDSVIQQMVE